MPDMSTADALRRALEKLEEAEQILWDGAYEGKSIDMLSDLQTQLRGRLGTIERSARAAWEQQAADPASSQKLPHSVYP